MSDRSHNVLVTNSYSAGHRAIIPAERCWVIVRVVHEKLSCLSAHLGGRLFLFTKNETCIRGGT
jgi:hypothetical protein